MFRTGCLQQNLSMLFYVGNPNTSCWLFDMRTHFLLAMLLVSSLFAALPAQANGRAIEFTAEISRYDWLSNETVPMDVQLKNAQFNTNYTIFWELEDVDGVIVDSGTIVFKATATVTSNIIELKHFYNSNHFYTFQADLYDPSGTLLAQSDRSFTVFQNQLIAPIGNLEKRLISEIASNETKKFRF